MAMWKLIIYLTVWCILFPINFYFNLFFLYSYFFCHSLCVNFLYLCLLYSFSPFLHTWNHPFKRIYFNKNIPKISFFHWIWWSNKIIEIIAKNRFNKNKGVWDEEEELARRHRHPLGSNSKFSPPFSIGSFRVYSMASPTLAAPKLVSVRWKTANSPSLFAKLEKENNKKVFAALSFPIC